MEKRPDAIHEVCRLIDDEYLSFLPATTEAALNHWQSDTLAHLREGFRVQEMRREHHKIVHSALDEWKDREAIVLRKFEHSHDRFFHWFASLRDTMWRNQTIPLRSFAAADFPDAPKRFLKDVTELSRRVVVNVQWCRAFGSFLPLAIPDMRSSLARAGVSMCSIFYLELIAKERDRNGLEEAVPLDRGCFEMEKIDSLWRRANELR